MCILKVMEHVYCKWHEIVLYVLCTFTSFAVTVLAGKNYALVLFQSFSICFAQRHEGHKDLCFSTSCPLCLCAKYHLYHLRHNVPAL